MVVFDRRDVHAGRATLQVTESDVNSSGPPAIDRAVTLPAVAVDPPPGLFPVALIAPEVVAKTGFPAQPAKLLLKLTRPPSDAERDAAAQQLGNAGLDPYSLYVERGYVSDYGIGLLALAIASALVTLGAAGVATGLAQADSGPTTRPWQRSARARGCGGRWRCGRRS
jgi:putative ABC transport system permease protein